MREVDRVVGRRLAPHRGGRRRGADALAAAEARRGLETCETSSLPVGRVASFVGSMPAIDGATQMQMRFELQRRRPAERLWRSVKGAQGFGVWETADPGRAGFVFHKRVDGLQVPATYRAGVRLRWLDGDGEILRSARRRTAACAQPDLRPDLVVKSLRAVLDARPAFAIYTVLVCNDGRSDAGPFAVQAARRRQRGRWARRRKAGRGRRYRATVRVRPDGAGDRRRRPSHRRAGRAQQPALGLSAVASSGLEVLVLRVTVTCTSLAR